ncbi:unnamed protein product [Symbiodinium necroappetens]|uniref:Uncharacterized protein n=1 Tax=Symbiodinium necroappetens TaxID=1628268 RepID=A0A812TAK4_9DINO|nr:unnamed protein product [Symbiodinium necroappetens]
MVFTRYTFLHLSSLPRRPSKRLQIEVTDHGRCNARKLVRPQHFGFLCRPARLKLSHRAAGSPWQSSHSPQVNRMTFARALAIKAVQEQANRDAHDTATSERWVNSQVVSIKSTCVAASKRCEFSVEILTDSLPFLYQQEGQKKLLKELRARLGQLGFTKLGVSQEFSGEDAGKARVSMSWAGLEPSKPSPKCCTCSAFLWTLPTLLTKGFRTAQTEKRFASPLKLPLKSHNAERSCRPWNTSELSC